MKLEDQRFAHNGMGENVRCFLGLFYDNDGMVGSRDSEWLQNLMNVLFGLFQRYGLTANVTKSCTITCQPGSLRLGMLEDSRALKWTGVGDYYRARLRKRIPCPECRVELTAWSMTAHYRHMHRTEQAIDWNCLPVSQTKQHPQVYDMSFPRSINRCPYPFPGC